MIIRANANLAVISLQLLRLGRWSPVQILDIASLSILTSVQHFPPALYMLQQRHRARFLSLGAPSLENSFVAADVDS